MARSRGSPDRGLLAMMPSWCLNLGIRVGEVRLQGRLVERPDHDGAYDRHAAEDVERGIAESQCMPHSDCGLYLADRSGPPVAAV